MSFRIQLQPVAKMIGNNFLGYNYNSGSCNLFYFNLAYNYKWQLQSEFL